MYQCLGFLWSASRSKTELQSYTPASRVAHRSYAQWILSAVYFQTSSLNSVSSLEEAGIKLKPTLCTLSISSNAIAAWSWSDICGSIRIPSSLMIHHHHPNTLQIFHLGQDILEPTDFRVVISISSCTIRVWSQPMDCKDTTLLLAINLTRPSLEITYSTFAYLPGSYTISTVLSGGCSA
jgi:hypothetical protein